MAKVAASGPVPSSEHRWAGDRGASKMTTGIKRKTPSELRGEQLKRKNVVELVDESPAPLPDSLRDTNGTVAEVKQADLSKNPRYIDTRVDDLFPVRKNSIRLRLLSKKQTDKEVNPTELIGKLKASFVPSNLSDVNQEQISRSVDSFSSVSVTKGAAAQVPTAPGKCSGSTFRTVTELSSAGEKLSTLSTVDMNNALKGLVAHGPLIVSVSSAESSEKHGNPMLGNFCSEFNIPGKKTPLDFTLKTNMRIVSSSSVNWFHRLISCASFDGMAQFMSQVGQSENQSMNLLRGLASTTQAFRPNALRSWVYPQSSLPHSAISVLASSEGGDFLSKRQLGWQDSLRSLYYMLRKNICKIFYVCTSQFVVMFIRDDGSGKSKCACSAYISRSTRGLRSLLKEHDVSFSMPLCNSKVEQVNPEDLVELSEIEKHNLGQTRHVNSMSDVDNSPQSLLAFTGNKNVHELYDFLLNYRFFISSLAGIDVPLLYSSVPFENASLSAPEVICKEVRRADHMSFLLKDSNMTDANQGLSSGLFYSVEIKDAYLPPWISSSVCDTMGSDGISFEASFVTEPTSIGLNVGLDVFCQNLAEPKDMEGSSHSLGIQSTIISPQLRPGFLKGLKYFNGSYTAFVSPV